MTYLINQYIIGQLQLISKYYSINSLDFHTLFKKFVPKNYPAVYYENKVLFLR